jgi:hypothetical protein
MELNPPGLIIEDFNMTFELRRKRLGKVAFEPTIYGTTQDPDTLPDYYRQATRWSLGFWQTLRRHGLWMSWFSAALGAFVLEALLGSLILLVVALAVFFLAADPISRGLAVRWWWYLPEYLLFAPVLSPRNLLFFLFAPDYLLTCVAAIWLRRPSMLVYGLGFLLVRVVDALVIWRTLPKAWFTRSTGRWKSPTRRPVDASAPLDVVARSDRAGEDDGGLALAATTLAATGSVTRRGRLASPQRAVLVFRDSLLAGTGLAIAVGVAQLGVPVLVVVVTSVLTLGLAVAFGHRLALPTGSERDNA